MGWTSLQLEHASSTHARTDGGEVSSLPRQDLERSSVICSSDAAPISGTCGALPPGAVQVALSSSFFSRAFCIGFRPRPPLPTSMVKHKSRSTEQSLLQSVQFSSKIPRTISHSSATLHASAFFCLPSQTAARQARAGAHNQEARPVHRPLPRLLQPICHVLF